MSSISLLSMALLDAHVINTSDSWGDHIGTNVFEILSVMFAALKLSHCVLASGAKYAKLVVSFMLSKIPLGSPSVQGVG